MLSNREKLILKAVVEEFIETGEPVGSKFLTFLPYLNSYSSATLRADMAILEVKGYLTKTHTSSGRVPSEKGYKYYVNNLLTRNDDVMDLYPLIDTIIENNKFSLEKAIDESIELLSKLTNLAAFASLNGSEDVSIIKIELVKLSINKCLLIIITDNGNINHQTINIPKYLNVEDLNKVIRTLNNVLVGKTVSNSIQILKNRLLKTNIKSLMDYEDYILNTFIEALDELRQDGRHLVGFERYLANSNINDTETLKEYLLKLNEDNVCRLLADDTGLSIRFSSDIEFIPQNNCTIISIPYSIDDEENGFLAIIGPSRMDYKKTIPLVEYIASALSKFRK